ncbi:MAG: hypothetical protein ACM3X6_09330 [Patescibacteria group bacterium]
MRAKISAMLQKMLAGKNETVDARLLPVLVRFAEGLDLEEMNRRHLGGRGRILPIAGVVAAALNLAEISALSAADDVVQVCSDETMRCKETASS